MDHVDKIDNEQIENMRDAVLQSLQRFLPESGYSIDVSLRVEDLCGVQYVQFGASLQLQIHDDTITDESTLPQRLDRFLERSSKYPRIGIQRALLESAGLAEF